LCVCVFVTCVFLGRVSPPTQEKLLMEKNYPAPNKIFLKIFSSKDENRGASLTKKKFPAVPKIFFYFFFCQNVIFRSIKVKWMFVLTKFIAPLLSTNSGFNVNYSSFLNQTFILLILSPNNINKLSIRYIFVFFVC
jgi:hypothetical protein